jgi:hypothetical protein
VIWDYIKIYVNRNSDVRWHWCNNDLDGVAWRTNFDVGVLKEYVYAFLILLLRLSEKNIWIKKRRNRKIWKITQWEASHFVLLTKFYYSGEIKKAGKGRTRCTHRRQDKCAVNLAEKPKSKASLDRQRRRWEDNIGMDLRVWIYRQDWTDSGYGPVVDFSEHCD